jgi:hypothetical protein
VTIFTQTDVAGHNSDFKYAFQYLKWHPMSHDHHHLAKVVTVTNVDGSPHLKHPRFEEDCALLLGKPLTAADMPLMYSFGAIFAVTRKALLARPLAFWQRLRSLALDSTSDHRLGYIFEGLWVSCFC